MFSKAIALLALAASVSAHMKIKYPVPFGDATLNNSPLAPGDFPCKQRAGVYAVTEMNQWNAGQTQTVSFYGSAVHGGGSCQFSITTDPEPTEQSQWKVIQSVVGGCPSNVTGNLPGDDRVETAATFPVTMPSNIPDGRYTFAWTWINKVGNREFYMNCAPIQVGSGTGSASASSAASALAALPNMFVVNLPATECSTKENEDFNYPEPGQSIIEGNGAALGDTLVGAGCAKQTKLGAGNGQIGTPTQPETPAQSKPAATTAPAQQEPEETAIPSNPGGVFAPGASSAPVAAPTVQPAPVASTAPTAAPSKPSSTPEQPSYNSPPKSPDNNDTNTPTTPVTDGQCTPCTNDGAVVCIGSNQFGLCNRGCAVAQDLALGMACSNGVVVAATKRSIHFPRAHIHRRHGSSRFL
jgi:hypothetical protein